MTMKKITLILLLATTTYLSYPQGEDNKHISGSIGLGWMDGPACELQAGYTTGLLSFNTGFITPLSFEPNDSRVIYFKPEFAVRAGQHGAIGLGTGYCMHLFKNQEYRDEQLTTGLTTTGIIFSLRYLHEIDERVYVHGGATATRAVVSFSLGVRIKIINLN